MKTQQTTGPDMFGMAFAVLCLAGVVYFSFAAIQGNYGLFRKLEIEAQEEKLTRELARLEAQRKDLQNRTTGLSTRQLDLDLLDERARKVLGLARGDEIIIR